MAEQIDTLSKYGQSFQSKVVSALLTDNKFLDTIGEITTTKFFENDATSGLLARYLSITMSSENLLHLMYLNLSYLK